MQPILAYGKAKYLLFITQGVQSVFANFCHFKLIYYRAGGGICGAIHSAAGRQLAKACDEIGGCPTGETVITPGFNLPAKYVLHSVGPTKGLKGINDLISCYETILALCKENSIRTVAMCCISTGIFGFPNLAAAVVALNTTRSWLSDQSNADSIDKIIFCTFQQEDTEIYDQLTALFFPLTKQNEAAHFEPKLAKQNSEKKDNSQEETQQSQAESKATSSANNNNVSSEDSIPANNSNSSKVPALP
jgi:O-acetyl-ADP-ribose deacetylase (regulator of RNase III)